MIPHENKLTRNLRRKVESYDDPYLLEMQPQEVAVCRECKAVYAGQRWELEGQAAQDLANAKCIINTLCPACKKIRDRQPSGIVTLSGSFIQQHEEEIVNLINHENKSAMSINPLERIIDIDRSDSQLVIQTTNEKLAQRIGRAVYKSYSGNVEYKWSKGNKLVRVNWHRD